jgi:hypothetical protein
VRRGKILICCIYREFKKWGETENVSDRESECRIREWLERIRTILDSDREIWIMGDWNADYNRCDDIEYPRKRIVNLIK